MNKLPFYIFLLYLVFSFSFAYSGSNDPLEKLQQARNLFYKSVENKKHIDESIDLFNQLSGVEEFEGRAMTYIGALTALKGKHSFLPQNKLKWTNKGLDIMEQGIDKNPEDIESLFIFSSTCYYLPFFFHRDDDAQQNFKNIDRLLHENMYNYEPEIIKNVIQFLLENAELNSQEYEIINDLLKSISRV